MSSSRRPVNVHKAYHAHVYFDEQTQTQAKHLCEQIASEFALAVGRFHTKQVGPHPCWSCQISFSTNDYETFIPWLDKHRDGLTVFVHALSGDDWRDHTEFAYWLGEAVDLNLAFFKQ